MRLSLLAVVGLLATSSGFAQEISCTYSPRQRDLRTGNLEDCPTANLPFESPLGVRFDSLASKSSARDLGSSGSVVLPLPAWAEDTRPAPATHYNAGFLENLGRAWVQDSFVARGAEDLGARLLAWGALKPPRVDGYSPYRDKELAPFLEANTDSWHRFREADSPAEAQFIVERVRQLRDRQTALEEGGAGFSRILATLLRPEFLLFELGFITWIWRRIVTRPSPNLNADPVP